jgi:transcriptional regulator with XRE-family HTH domain
VDVTAPTIARIPCGANIPCGDWQKSLAYPLAPMSKIREIPAADRAIGARIKEARLRLGVSITDLGLAYGGHRQTVQHWEAGKNFPPLSDFPRLCELLRTSPNIILGMTDELALSDRDLSTARTNIEALARTARIRAAMRNRAPVVRLQRRRRA